MQKDFRLKKNLLWLCVSFFLLSSVQSTSKDKKQQTKPFSWFILSTSRKQKRNKSASRTKVKAHKKLQLRARLENVRYNGDAIGDKPGFFMSISRATKQVLWTAIIVDRVSLIAAVKTKLIKLEIFACVCFHKTRLQNLTSDVFWFYIFPAALNFLLQHWCISRKENTKTQLIVEAMVKFSSCLWFYFIKSF